MTTMSVHSSHNGGVPEAELRQRLPQHPEKPQQATSPAAARQTVIDLNKAEESKDLKDRKTYGRTPDGTVFVVPETHDMVGVEPFPRLADDDGDANMGLVV